MPDESCFRGASYALNWISKFLLHDPLGLDKPK